MSRLPELGEPLANGRVAEVYPWGDSQVLKLFRAGTSRDVVEAERENMLRVEPLGLPIPKPGETVTVANRIGLAMAAVTGPTMMELIMRQPEQLTAFARQLADLHIYLHRLPAPAGMPSLAALLQRKIERSVRLTPAEKKGVLAALVGMPGGNTLCHGDFHPGNLLMGERGPVIIDWSDAGCGPSMADVARTSLLCAGHIALSASNPSAQAPMRQFRDTYLDHRLGALDGDRDQLRRWRPILAAARLAEGIDEQLDWLHEQVRKSL